MATQQGAILVTGGLGFIGLNLAKKISQAEHLICRPIGNALTKPAKIILVDHPSAIKNAVELNALNNEFEQYNVSLDIQYGDVASKDFIQSIVTSENNVTSIFHLASVMSGQGEQDFDLALQTNLQGTMNLLEAARGNKNHTTFIFSSNFTTSSG